MIANRGCSGLLTASLIARWLGGDVLCWELG
jgi:hypothetical protein